VCGIVQQSRLAYTGIPAKKDRSAAVAHRVDHSPEQAHVFIAANKLGSDHVDPSALRFGPTNSQHPRRESTNSDRSVTTS
jgi:hypothetical protein